MAARTFSRATARIAALSRHLTSATASASSPAVQVCRDGHVTTVVLHRPLQRNAVDGKTAAQLAAAFREFDADDNARVAVLYGEGGTFCSGADLKAIGTESMNVLDPHGDGPMGPTRFVLSKPVIAAISGHAVAGGLELALWCDLRVMEESAQFGVFCRRWGVPLIDGGTARLPTLIGLSRALDLTLTGRPVDSKEAFAIGLANRVVADGGSRQAAEDLARQIAKFPQVCLRRDRMSMITNVGKPIKEAMGAEFERGMDAMSEAAQGAARFAQGAGRSGKFE